MNFSAKTTAWILLIALVISTGGTIAIANIVGGANKWIAIATGIVAAATNVYHALNTKPGGGG